MQRSLIYRVHALQRMFERGISQADVEYTVASGKVVASYEDDRPYPSRLVLAWVKDRPIHVVAADRTDAPETIIITVYQPDPQQWNERFDKRRR